jgi:RHS repeat-associated protein
VEEDGAGPHAVTTVDGGSYEYDANGRMTTRGRGNTLTWYSYDLPKSLAAGTKTAEFFYGVGRDRYKQIQKTSSTTDATIYYVGSLFEKEIAGATTTYRHHVSARGRTLATVSRVATTNTVQYLHRDQQNSVVEVTGSTGTLVQSLAFDVWGLRRNASTWAALGSPFAGSEPTERGYTGHEHLDSVGLIHMNGRVQDPKFGRFISADPFVQAPYNAQSLDRYSYVWNNPTSYVDPSGFWCEGISLVARGPDDNDFQRDPSIYSSHCDIGPGDLFHQTHPETPIADDQSANPGTVCGYGGGCGSPQGGAAYRSQWSEFSHPQKNRATGECAGG